MKKDQIKLGGIYLAKVTDKVVSVRLDAENPHGGWDATNLATNKKVRIKSAQRLRGPAPQRSADPDRIPLSEAMKPAEPKAKKPSGLATAAKILKDAGQPMRCGDIVEKMLATGLWKTGGKTPAATIYAAIIREISTKGDESRFKKTDRGLFTINAK